MNMVEEYIKELRIIQEKINIVFKDILKKLNEDDLIKLKESINESLYFDFA
jgi:hypothetical protein